MMKYLREQIQDPSPLSDTYMQASLERRDVTLN